MSRLTTTSTAGGGMTATGVPFKQPDLEDLQTLWELREHLTLKQTPVTRYDVIIRDFSISDPQSNLSPYYTWRSIRQAQLEPVKGYVLNHPLIRFYDQVAEANEKGRNFETLCRKDAMRIDKIAESVAPKHWKDIVADYFKFERNRHDSKAWRPVIAEIETDRVRMRRQLAEVRAMRRRREEQARWHREEAAKRPDNPVEVEEQRFQEVNRQKVRSDAEQSRQQDENKTRQTNQKLDCIARELDYQSAIGMPTLPYQEPYTGKTTGGSLGLSGSNKDYSRQKARAPTPPPELRAREKTRREEIEERDWARKMASRGKDRSATPTQADHPIPKEHTD